MAEYRPLRRFNPDDDDLTKESSAWLSSRLQPSRGNDVAADGAVAHPTAIPHFADARQMGMFVPDEATTRVVGNAAVGAAVGGGAGTVGLRMERVGSGEASAAIENVGGARLLAVWNGMWAVDGGVGAWTAIIGEAEDRVGITCPYNTFNAGYRWRRHNWRATFELG